MALLFGGRKTYELVKNLGSEYITEEITNAVKIIISHNSKFQLKSGYILANSPQQAIEILKKEGFKTTILTGGSQLNISFAKASLIDEVLLNIEPVVIAKGIPLFFPKDFDLKLKLLNIRKVQDDIIQLHYKVKK